MKTPKSLVTAAVIALLAVSCKKQSDIQTPQVNARKNFTEWMDYYENNLDDLIKLKYDNAGRVIEMAGMYSSKTFEYLSATQLIVTDKKKSDNSIVGISEATLNANGAIKLIVRKDQAGVVLDSTSISYNSEGYLIKFINKSPAASYGHEYVIENGKIKSGKLFNNGVQTGTEVYKLDESNENRQSFTAWDWWPLPNFFGRPLRFLPSELIQYHNSGEIRYHTKSNYERDAEGNVLKKSTDYISDGTQGVQLYKY